MYARLPRGLCRGLARRPAWLSCLAAMLLVLLCCTDGVAAALMTLNRQAENVAGTFGAINDVDGPKGVSTLTNPLSMCASYNNDPNLLLIGQLNTFRIYNMTSQYTSTWNTSYPHPQGTVICDCVTVKLTVTAVFYVTCANPSGGGNTTLYRLTANGASRHSFGAQASTLVAVTTPVGGGQSNMLYVLDNNGLMMGCSLNPSTADILSCTPTTTLQIARTDTSYGLAVSGEDVFVTTGEGLFRFGLSDGRPRPGLATQRNFLDVHYTTRITLPPQLMAITTDNFFLITANDTGMYAQGVLSNPNEPCKREWVNTSSSVPVFCAMAHFYPITPDIVFGILSAVNLLRELYLPPVQTALRVAPPPFPVGMDNASTTLSTIYELIDNNLLTLLQPPTGADEPQVNRTSVAVQPYPWPTTMGLLIPQRLYDNDTTEAAIRALPFTDVTQAVTAYYDRTNLALYGDANVFPLCNRTKMNLIEPQTAYFARAVLQYPLIYSDPLEVLTLGGNPNITRVKLLLPWSFDDGVNVTARTLLEQANYSAFILDVIADTYDSNHKGLVVFHGETYNLDSLNAGQLFDLRWIVRQVIERQLAYCKSVSGGGSQTQSADIGSSASLSCAPTVAITNMTRVPLVSRLYPDYRYTVFVPESYDYNFNLNQCLGLIDWSFLQDWISGAVKPSHHRRCGTGCIVGVAVAAAVVATVLIIVLIVLVSKRRRLATVVVPPPLKEPEFASTVDLDERSDNSNPLRA